MYIRKINNQLLSLIETKEPTKEMEVSIKDFVELCKAQGYIVKPSTQYNNHYIVNINGYKILIAATSAWNSYKLDGKDFVHSIEYSPVYFSGYMKITPKNVLDFNSVEEYYTYTLKIIEDFANNKIKESNLKKIQNQTIQNKIEELNNNQKIILNKAELLSILKKLDDDTQLSVELIK